MSSRHSKGKGISAGGGGKGVGGGGGGGSPKGPRAPLSNIAQARPNLSCLVRIEPVAPNYGEQPVRHTRGQNYWQPPNIKKGLMAGDRPPSWFRWMGGRLSTLPANYDIRGLEVYGVATVFTQRPDTPHLLAVPYNAMDRDVRSTGLDWQPLTFNHEQIGQTNTYFSYVTSHGLEQRLAARGSPHWIGQLLPEFYDCDPDTDDSTRYQGGLIGHLPLLFALAAFSAPPPRLGALPSFLQPGAWVPHQLLSGHVPERGMIVTIYLDRDNPIHSTRALLDRLQEGAFGPFYGP